MNSIDVYRHRVVMDREAYDLLLYRAGLQTRLINGLRGRLEEYDALLRTALHELALQQEEKEPQLFSRRWIQAKRREPDPIPLRRDHKRGGEASRNGS